MEKTPVTIHITKELHEKIRIEAAKIGGRGANSKLVEAILREGFGMEPLDDEGS